MWEFDTEHPRKPATHDRPMASPASPARVYLTRRADVNADVDLTSRGTCARPDRLKAWNSATTLSIGGG